jgi:hypothetical protein
MLATFTETLTDLGFRSAGISAEGPQHRWVRGEARRPNVVGALVGKAAALGNAGDPGLGRHRRDFVVLAGLLTARHFGNHELTRKDRQRPRAMVTAVGKDRALLSEIPEAQISLDRLITAGEL